MSNSGNGNQCRLVKGWNADFRGYKQRGFSLISFIILSFNPRLKIRLIRVPFYIC